MGKKKLSDLWLKDLLKEYYNGALAINIMNVYLLQAILKERTQNTLMTVGSEAGAQAIRAALSTPTEGDEDEIDHELIDQTIKKLIDEYHYSIDELIGRCENKDQTTLALIAGILEMTVLNLQKPILWAAINDHLQATKHHQDALAAFPQTRTAEPFTSTESRTEATRRPIVWQTPTVEEAQEQAQRDQALTDFFEEDIATSALPATDLEDSLTARVLTFTSPRAPVPSRPAPVVPAIPAPRRPLAVEPMIPSVPRPSVPAARPLMPPALPQVPQQQKTQRSSASTAPTLNLGFIQSALAVKSSYVPASVPAVPKVSAPSRLASKTKSPLNDALTEELKKHIGQQIINDAGLYVFLYNMRVNRGLSKALKAVSDDSITRTIKWLKETGQIRSPNS